MDIPSGCRVSSCPPDFGIYTRLTGCGRKVPEKSCSFNREQFSRRYSGSSSTVIPSMPVAPALAFTRLSASFRFSFSHASSISLSVSAWFSVLSFVAVDSVPPSGALGASPLPSPSKANSCWVFCRSSTSSRSPYSPSLPFGPQVTDPTMPSADFWQAVKDPRESLSPDSGTPARPPGVGSTAFSAQPPDLQPLPLMDMGFVVIGPLARFGMPRIRFLFVRPALCTLRVSSTCGFLQIPSHDGHPCRPANGSPCRVRRGLPPPSWCALPGAPTKKGEPFRAPLLVACLRSLPRSPLTAGR